MTINTIGPFPVRLKFRIYPRIRLRDVKGHKSFVESSV